MCSPDFFDVKYKINPWMNPKKKSVEKEKVFKQWEQLKNTYEDLGLTVYSLKQRRSLPDMVYTANLGFVINDIFIKSNFKHHQRKKEAHLGEKFFKEMGLDIYKLPKGLDFEGQGDLLKVGNDFFYGWGKRSNPRAKRHLKKGLGIKNIIDLKLVDPFYYHLDTCFGPLNEETVVINPKSFTKEGLKKIYKSVPDVIEVGPKDNKKMFCNLVTVGNMVITSLGVSEKLRNQLGERGFSVIEIPMDQFRLGGGSVKCLTLEFFKM